MAKEVRTEYLNVRLTKTEMRRLKEEADRQACHPVDVMRQALGWWWITGSRHMGEVTAELAGELVSRLNRAASRTLKCKDHRFGDRGICFTCGEPRGAARA